MRGWSQDTYDTLQVCLGSTYWSCIENSYREDVEGSIDSFTDYVKFWEDNILTKRKVSSFHNNKPWITSELNALMNEKIAFRESYRDRVKQV